MPAERDVSSVSRWRRRACKFAAASIAGSVACSNPPVDTATPDVRVSDSSGVRIVSNSARDRPLAIREVLRIGVIEGNPDLQFDRVRTLAVDSTGGIWVSDSHESVRHYSASGEYLGRVGGLGEGPGEAAEGYGDVWLGHGTVLTVAYGARLQLFRPDGTFLGSRLLRNPSGGYLRPLGPAGSDWMLLLQQVPARAEGLLRMRWTVGRGPVTGPGFDTLFTKPGEGLLVTGPEGLSHASFFDGNPAIRGDARGNVYYSHHMDYRIEVYDSSGVLRQIVSRPVPARPYPPGLESEIEAGIRDALRDGPPPRPVDREEVSHMTAQALPAGTPEHLPFLEALLVSRDGFIWAQRGDRHPRPAMRAVAAAFGFIRSLWPPAWRAPSVFDLFTPDGVYRGTVEAPFGFVPLAVTQNRIWGVTRDELDVEYVVAYSIEDKT